MPIYEYQCTTCGHELEKLQRMSDDALRDCPACEKPDLKRLISAAAFRLKGAGWYETDFKKDNRRNLVDSGDKDKSSAAKPAASKPTDKNDTKPVAKPVTKTSGTADATQS